jgi:tetratricopeptide (TPR) repeat protein
MIDQGLFKKATMLLQKIVLESPKQIGNRVLLAKAMRSAGQLDEALAEMEAVLVEAPDEHPALTQAAGALFTRWQQTGSVADLEQAMTYLDRALVLTESDGQNWILRGEMKRLSGDLEGAASDYRHAAVIYQHKPGLTLQAADLYIQTGGHQEALSLLSGLRGIFPADLNLLLLSAKAHESAGDRDAALRDVGQAAAVAPDDPRVRALMAELAQP